MNDTPDEKMSRSRPTRAGGGRADRLAEALRANLKRRKAQARARRGKPDEEAPAAGGGRGDDRQDD